MAAAVQSLAAGSCHEPFARGFIQGPTVALEPMLLQGLYEHPESMGAALWAQGGFVGL